MSSSWEQLKWIPGETLLWIFMIGATALVFGSHKKGKIIGVIMLILSSIGLYFLKY